jgi:hypothetical protein
MSLVDLAEDTGAAIVMIRHFNKAAGMNAKNRGGGSVAYSALVRSVLQAGKLDEPGDGGATFAIARAIGNLSKTPLTITYRLDSAPAMAELPQAEDDELGVAVVKYCGTTELDADQLAGADSAKPVDARQGAPVREDAAHAIRDMLTDGPQRADDVIITVIEGVLCSKGTVKAAAKELGVVKKKVYGGGKIDHWTWQMPPDIVKIADFTKGTKRNAK